MFSYSKYVYVNMYLQTKKMLQGPSCVKPDCARILKNFVRVRKKCFNETLKGPKPVMQITQDLKIEEKSIACMICKCNIICASTHKLYHFKYHASQS